MQLQVTTAPEDRCRAIAHGIRPQVIAGHVRPGHRIARPIGGAVSTRSTVPQSASRQCLVDCASRLHCASRSEIQASVAADSQENVVCLMVRVLQPGSGSLAIIVVLATALRSADRPAIGHGRQANRAPWCTHAPVSGEMPQRQRVGVPRMSTSPASKRLHLVSQEHRTWSGFPILDPARSTSARKSSPGWAETRR